MKSSLTIGLGVAVLLATAALSSCRDAPSAPAPSTPAMPFTDVTNNSGIDFTTTGGRADAQFIAEVKGGGLALIDIDNDGDQDLVVPNGQVPPGTPAPRPTGIRVFKNQGDLRFTDITAQTGIDFDGWGMGVAVGDVDGDGLDDLFISAVGPNQLYRNAGNGTFENITTQAGLQHDAFTTAAALGDIDSDGDLDLYVAGYTDIDVHEPPPPSTYRGYPVPAGPRGLDAQPDRLYLNRGDGTFDNVTESSGIGAVEPSYGLGVVILDLDQDQRPEIFVGNDSEPNFLFRNLGGGRFQEIGLDRGIATAGDGSSRATMGIAIADIDHNGLPDFFTTNFAGEPNTLQVNRPGLFFDDVTRRYAIGLVGFAQLGWAATFADFDHDGDEDLLFINGHVYPDATAETMFSDHAQAPILLARHGDRFRRVDATQSGSWLLEKRCDRSMVTGDLDSDGDLDVISSGLNEPLRVLRNDAGEGHWLIVAPEAPLGTTVIVERGEQRWQRTIVSGTGYLSASEPVAHFGLGDQDTPVRVTVIWPNNDRFTSDALPVDQRVKVRRPR
jgi:hypothetical protein